MTAAKSLSTLPSQIARHVKGIGVGAASLVQGLAVTVGYLFNKKRVVTEEYPENRRTLAMHPRFRGMVVMPHDENGDHNCTACSICEKACPNGSISVLATKSISGQRVLGQYVYRFSQCTLCNLCVESCPFDAIRMGQVYETATDDKKTLDLVLNRKEGRS